MVQGDRHLESSKLLELVWASFLSCSDDSEEDDGDTISHSILGEDRVKEDQAQPLKERVTIGDREERVAMIPVTLRGKGKSHDSRVESVCLPLGRSQYHSQSKKLRNPPLL